MMAPLEGSWTRRGLRGGSTGSAPKFMLQIPYRRPEGSAPAGAFRRPTGATPRLLGRRWPPYRAITNKRPVNFALVRGVGDAAPTAGQSTSRIFSYPFRQAPGVVGCPPYRWARYPSRRDRGHRSLQTSHGTSHFFHVQHSKVSLAGSGPCPRPFSCSNS